MNMMKQPNKMLVFSLFLICIISHVASSTDYVTDNVSSDSRHHVTPEATAHWDVKQVQTVKETTENNVDGISTTALPDDFGLENKTDNLAPITGVIIGNNFTDLVTMGTTTNLALSSSLQLNLFSILIITISGGGLFGNINALILLNRKSIKKTPCRTILIAVALSDSINLLVAYPAYFNVNAYYTWGCITRTYAYILSLYFSKFLIMGISLERFLVICFPMKAKTILKNTNTEMIYCIVSFLVIVASFSYGPHFYRLVPIQTPAHNVLTYQCALTDQGNSYAINVFGWIEIGFSLIPTVVIIVTTISMIVALIRSCGLGGRNDSENSAEKNAWAASALLVTTCISFTVLGTPLIIYVMIKPELVEGIQNYDTLGCIFLTMDLLNSAGNCVVYIASGSMFRKEIKNFYLEVLAKTCRRNADNIDATVSRNNHITRTIPDDKC